MGRGPRALEAGVDSSAERTHRRRTYRRHRAHGGRPHPARGSEREVRTMWKLWTRTPTRRPRNLHALLRSHVVDPGGVQRSIGALPALLPSETRSTCGDLYGIGTIRARGFQASLRRTNRPDPRTSRSTKAVQGHL